MPQGIQKIDLTKFKKAVFVFNRNSGRQLFASTFSKVNEAVMLLRRHYPKLDLELFPLFRFDEMPAIAEHVKASGAEWVIIAGGDGTIRAFLEELRSLKLKPYISVFPGGTVNLIAKELRLVNDPERWVRRASKGRVAPVYIGKANGKLFLTVAGIGFDSLVVHGVTLREKKFLSKLAYVVQGTEVMRRELLFSNWRYHFKVRLDGGEWLEASSVIVGKSRYYAGHYNLFRKAELSSKFFHVAIFHGNKRADILRYASLIAMESLAIARDIELLPARKIEIILAEGNEDLAEGEFPVELDGDAVTATPVNIEICEEPLSFLI